MSTATGTEYVGTTNIDARVNGCDWPRIDEDLDTSGWSLAPKLLTASECGVIAGLYPDDRHFRSHIVMARHGFGRGEYKYFSHPLPDTITALRTTLYARLTPIANR